MNRFFRFLTVGSVLLATISSAQVTFRAKMNGAQEVPAVAGTATGTGVFVLNKEATSLTYTITVTGLTGTINAAHFHDGASGVAGGVVKNITFVGGTATGTWSSTDAAQPLTDSLLADLVRGKLYVNAHTPAHPGGEIRGQVTLQTGIGFTASWNGAQENPAIVTNATGTAWLWLDTTGTVLRYGATVNGLSGSISASHFHNAPAGTNGPVVKNISFSHDTSSGTWTSTDSMQPLTNTLLVQLVRGRTYLNVHTPANPGGEIRGQVLLNNGATAYARMQGSQENPAGATPAVGTASIVLNPGATSISYTITIDTLSGAISASHFHNGAVGSNGPVVKNITFTGNSASGIWSSTDATQPLTDSLISEFLHGRLYVNAHTAANPGGELRGQVTLVSPIGYTISMSGDQEVPAVVSTGTGTGVVILDPSGTAAYDVTVDSLSGAISAAHFHTGAMGVNGGVVKPVTVAGNTFSGTWGPTDASQPLTDVLLRELVKGRTYFNVHTALHGGGEIRGQVVGATVNTPTSVSQISSEIPQTFTLSQNYPNPFNPSTTIEFSLPKKAHATLSIYNVLGQRVAVVVDGEKDAGTYRVVVNAATLSSGLYIYRLNADGGISVSRRMILLK
ncbi:MAG TPA: CHRD domain-containing protein [Bacteroidota bacterium]|nr:CHRD domain-containing protein [Bacteroidota bacterium]